MLDEVPGERRIYAGRLELERESAACCPRPGASRWSTRPTARFRTSRASTPAPWISCRGLGVTRGVVRRPGRTFRGRLGCPAIATHRAASDRLYRIKDRAFDYVGAKLDAAGGRPRIRDSAGHGGMVRPTKAWSPTPRPSWRPRKTPEIRTTLRRRPFRVRSSPTKCWCSTSGASWTGLGRSTPILPGWDFQETPPAEVADVLRVVVGARDAAIAVVNRQASGRDRTSGDGRSTARPATS